jgi:hypothetical protein
MTTVWSHGIWTVKDGREDEFVAVWRELVPIGLGLGAGDPTLLRDREHTRVFRSFGPWPDADTIERFRAEIRPRIADMDDLLEAFKTFTLDEVYPDD